MPDLTVSEQDRQRAAQFLTRVLEEEFPDADFSPGSVTRDHTIGAVAHVVALIRAEASKIRKHTSLNLVDQLENEQEFTEAVDNLAANWFLSRNTGKRVKGTIKVVFDQTHEGVIPPDTTFDKSRSKTFKLNKDGPVIYDPSDMRTQTDSTGNIVGYYLRIPVISEGTGTEYNIRKGPFEDWERFSPHIRNVFNDVPFQGGEDPETAEELLDRAQDAITVRDLNSKRSITTVLKENFESVRKVVVKGMGDRGMERDRVSNRQDFYDFHTGGKMDVWAMTPLLKKQNYTAQVGASFQDSGKHVQIFRDKHIHDWRAEVSKGDVIRVKNALANEPGLFTIQSVHRNYVVVQGNQPFPDTRPINDRGEVFSGNIKSSGNSSATLSASSSSIDFEVEDETRYVRVQQANPSSLDGVDYRVVSVDVDNNDVVIEPVRSKDPVPSKNDMFNKFVVLDRVVHYSVGQWSPSYEDKVAPRTTGSYSRRWEEPGKILLPNHPVYRIDNVEVYAPSHPCC